MNSTNGFRIALWMTCIALMLCSCQPRVYEFRPSITYSPQVRQIEQQPQAFPPLTPEERDLEWGRELLIATSFALELDLYRAITAFKRALILLPENNSARRLQIEYGIVKCYYLGAKYWEALDFFEHSQLREAPEAFSPFDDLLVMLYDAYWTTCQYDKACRILDLIEQRKKKNG